MPPRMPLVLLLLVASAAACATAARLPAVHQEDVTRGAERFPGLTQADLVEGRTLYAGKCGSCHVLPAPASRAPTEWAEHVALMKRRAHLDDRQLLLIDRYLITMASSASAGGRSAQP